MSDNVLDAAYWEKAWDGMPTHQVLSRWVADFRVAGVTGQHATRLIREVVHKSTNVPSDRLDQAWASGARPDQLLQIRSGANLVAVFDPAQGLPMPSGAFTTLLCASVIFPKLAERRELFVYGDQLVRIDRRARSLTPVKPAEFCSMLETVGLPTLHQRMQGGHWVMLEERPSQAQAAALLACVTAKELTPKLNLLSEKPVLIDRDGKLVLLQAGFDEPSGIFVFDGSEVPDMTADEGAGLLLGLLREFHFVSEADRARAAVSFITPALQAAGIIRSRAPFNLHSADASQSAKTKLAYTKAAIYGEEPFLRAIAQGSVGGADEVASAALKSGKRFVVFDNVRGKIDSQTMESVLTAEGLMSVRTAWEKESRHDPRGIDFTVTSNGALLTADLANRSNEVRIYHRDGFHFTFDPLKDVRADQPRYLGAVYAVLREWDRAGRPKSYTDDAKSHNLDQWAGVVEWIALNVFKLSASPLQGFHALRATLAEVDDTLRQLAYAVRDNGLTGLRLRVAQLHAICLNKNIKLQTGRVPEQAKELGRALGAMFKKDGEPIEVMGIRVFLEQAFDKNLRKDVRVYRFECESAPPVEPNEKLLRHEEEVH